MRSPLLALLVLLVLAPTATAAGGWRTGVLARGVVDDEIAVATNARGVTAVAWTDDRLGVNVRLAGPSLRFGPVLSVPAPAPDDEGGRFDLQAAIGPRGEVVVAWTASEESGDEFIDCCTYAEAAMRRAGAARFGRVQQVAPQGDNVEALRAAVTADGRGVVAWSGWDDLGARLTARGGTRFGARRHPYEPDGANMEAIDATGARPHYVVTPEDGERLIWRGRTIARGSLNSLSVGLDARGPVAAAWQDSDQNTFLLTRGARGWRRQLVPRHDRALVEQVPLATARSGHALAATFSPSYLYVRRRAPGGLFGRAVRVPGAGLFAIATLGIGSGGHGVVAYPTGRQSDRMAAAVVRRDGTVGRRTLLGRRRGAEPQFTSSCSEERCSAATVTPAGRALVAWTDAGRLMVARRR